MPSHALLLVLSLLLILPARELRPATLSASAETHPAGDLDENGRVEIFDLLAMLRLLSGNPPTERQRRLADLERSPEGRIDIFDLLVMLRVLSGGPTPPPVVFANNLARLWAVGDGEKIFKSDTTHPLMARNSVWDGDTIRLAGLYNEVLGFQVIAVADSAGAPAIELALDPLAREGGGAEIAPRGAGPMVPAARRKSSPSTISR